MTLYELIQSIPEALAFAVAGNDVACADVLNAKTEPGLVPIAEISQWSFLQGVAPVINAHASNVSSPLYGLCYTVNAYFNSNRFLNIDLNLPQVVIMVNGLLAGGIVTQDQFDELIGLANNRVSIAAKTFGADVTVSDISAAMAVDRPDGKLQE